MHMHAVEFQAVVKDGVIQIPEIEKEEFEGKFVKVVVMKQAKKVAATGIIAELMKNPVKFEGKPFKREEIYDRE